MSKFKEDELYEIFTNLRKNPQLKNSWENEMKILKSKYIYNYVHSDLYIIAYNNIKK